MNRVLGLDLSLTASGLAIDLGPHVISAPKKMVGTERLSWFFDYTTKFIYAHEVNVALIEGYAFGSSFKREVLGELGGVVRLALHQAGVIFTTVAPTAVKKYATGKGNANKDEMLASAIQRSGLNITNNNAADAWWIYQMGLTHYNPELAVPMPELNRSALEKVEWPS